MGFRGGGPWFLRDGSIYVKQYDILENQKKIVRCIYRRLPSPMLQVWFPLLATAAITILAVAVPIGFSAPRSAGSSPPGEQSTPSRIQRIVSATRWAAIGAGLIALNLAGASYRPPPDRSDEDAWKKITATMSETVIDDAGMRLGLAQEQDHPGSKGAYSREASGQVLPDFRSAW